MNLDISVVIPVYNSANSLDKLYRRLSSSLRELCPVYEIILVDDGSTDASYKEMCRLHQQDTRVKAISLKRNYGQQNALMCGLSYSKGQIAITMDDDLQNPPEEIEKLVKKLEEGYDVVYGIPVKKKHSFYRNLGAVMRDCLFNIICNKPGSIRLSSFRAMKKSLVGEILKDRTAFVYISAITFRYSVKAANVCVKHDDRIYNSSGYTPARLAKLFFMLMVYYSPLSQLLDRTSDPQFEVRDIKL